MKNCITPFSEVNRALAELSAAIRAVLQHHFIGMYLCGSLALGDFDSGSSDIDTIVVTDGELPASIISDLKRIHTHFGESGSPWASRLEVAYAPLHALQIAVPPTALFLQVEKDRAPGLYPVESGWVIQLCTLREHGLVIAGPDPTSLIAPIAPDEVRRASAAHAVTWAEQVRSDPTWLTWMRNREHHAFVLSTLFRMLYSLRTGTVASKPGAARWMTEVIGTRWAELIHDAVAGRPRNGVASDREAEETIALINYVAQQYLEWRTGH